MARKKKKTTPVSDMLTKRAWSNIMSPSGLTSLTEFAKSQKNAHNLRELEKSLSKIEAFSRHRPLRRKFPRPSIIINRPWYSWCMDLIQMENKFQNRGYAWILILQDQFTKELALESLKHKNKEETAAALEKAIKRLGRNGRRVASIINSDAGNEFKNSSCNLIYKKYNIEHRIIQTGQKCAVCERTNRFLQEQIYKALSLTGSKKWVDLLPQIEAKYNRRKHHSTKLAPLSINSKNSELAFRNMYHKLIEKGRKPGKFKVGDTVRISEKQSVFVKKYKPQYSKAIYTIIKVKDTFPIESYRLANSEGEELNYTFVDEELSLAFKEPS